MGRNIMRKPAPKAPAVKPGSYRDLRARATTKMRATGTAPTDLYKKAALRAFLGEEHTDGQ